MTRTRTLEEGSVSGGPRRKAAARGVALVAVMLLALTAPGTPSAAADPPGVASAGVVHTWNDLALDTVRRHNASDAQAARLYAMVNVAIYDAVNGLEPPSRRRAEALVAPSPDRAGDPVAAASVAAHDVLVGLYPASAAFYDAQLASDLAAAGSPGQARQGRAWGEHVARTVLAARADDGSTPPETQPAAFGVGEFSAPWPGAQFRHLAPFAIADSSAYLGDGPPPLDSAAYATAFDEVKAVGNAAVPDPAALATYRFWALGSGTTQPPGAWVQVAEAVSESRSLPLLDAARLFALETMAMADTVAPTFATKYEHHSWRPQRAIQQADLDGNPATIRDAAWAPRAGSAGSSPEHWSGHSSFSSSAATVLAGFFCDDDIAFTLITDSPAPEVRHYGSFSAAAAEAGRSRVVGGIHFEFSNRAGLEAGRAIAAEVLATSLLGRDGPAHDC